jgi:hypothetical protein
MRHWVSRLEVLGGNHVKDRKFDDGRGGNEQTKRVTPEILNSVF